MECFVHADKKYFPEYNWFEKAISYPYKAPTTSFTFKNGKFYQGIHISLKNRVPIISIGSNRSPYQLKNKFGVKENLCVTPAKLYKSCSVINLVICLIKYFGLTEGEPSFTLDKLKEFEA